MTHPRFPLALRIILLASAGLCPGAVAAHAADPAATTTAASRTPDPLTPPEERSALHVPPGFEVQLVASEPEIGKPINLAIDARGRIWVAQSAEFPFPAKPGMRGKDALKVLDDLGPDGHAARVTTFADGLSAPMGVYPYRNGAVAYSAPYVSLFQDIDGSGKAERQDVLYGPYAYDREAHGIANGLRRGFDGWLYADHGFNNRTTLRGGDGQPIYLDTGHTFRMGLDGSRADAWTHGLGDPWGLIFDQRLRGPSINAAVTVYLDQQWPAEFRGNFFVADPIAGRIHRDSPVPHGSTILPRAEPDFLTSDDPRFHPVDLQLAPDGSMYVADFYSGHLVARSEAPATHATHDPQRGRIWRIVYKGDAATPPAPWRGDLDKASAPELIAALAHPNIKMRFLATDELTDRIGAAAVEQVKAAISRPVNANQKVHGLWVLHRLEALDAPTLASAAKEADAMIRAHAMRIFAEIPEWTADQRRIVLAGTADADAVVERCAADALGRHASVENVRPLLDLLEHVPADDVHLRYAARMALRDQLLVPDILAALPLPKWSQADDSAVVDVLVGIPGKTSAAFLAAHKPAPK